MLQTCCDKDFQLSVHLFGFLLLVIKLFHSRLRCFCTWYDVLYLTYFSYFPLFSFDPSLMLVRGIFISAVLDILSFWVLFPLVSPAYVIIGLIHDFYIVTFASKQIAYFLLKKVSFSKKLPSLIIVVGKCQINHLPTYGGI